ncbi:MAG: hypothetical protein A2X84_12140 [Desulfuromonadaceae bacterium GWC2_58_13]|nr:MAG: hypothetical protein A2X84_12140 [Desulfuromonadaceae bacterium GWC2_58_13]HAD03592.1 DUF2892 domain-containing protein [Desulfuromonas sp.]
MTHNVCSKTERIIRAVLGLAIFSLLFFLEAPINLLGLLGLILLATAVFRYCPISHLLGIDTCHLKVTHSG